MKYRNMGKWGLKISEIAVGSWMTDLKDTAACDIAEETINTAYEAGVNFFDCADAYSGGDAEKFLGKSLSKYTRPSYVLSSKVFFPTMPGPNGKGLSRKHIMESIDCSLERLGVDYLDLYFCHRYDPETPLEETIQAMSDLVDAGKILYWGVSEWSPTQLTRATEMIRTMNLRPMSVIQPQYNMVDRYIEDEIVEICAREGMGIVPFSPLSQGLLTGKYRKGHPIPEGSRATWQSDKQINALLTNQNLNKVEELISVADELGCSLPQVALAWALRLPQITSLIVGASKPSQLETNLGALDVELTDTALREIEEILDYQPFHRSIG